METWKAIAGFEGYEISDQGRVRSWKTRGTSGRRATKPHVLAPGHDECGRLHVTLRKNKRSYTTLISLLVLTSFRGKRPAGKEGCHKDDDKENNRLTNLYWGTKKQNAKDRDINGKTYRGERHWYAKHSDQTVQTARSMEGSAAAVGAALGLSPGYVRALRRGEGRKRTSQGSLL